MSRMVALSAAQGACSPGGVGTSDEKANRALAMTGEDVRSSSPALSSRVCLWFNRILCIFAN